MRHRSMTGLAVLGLMGLVACGSDDRAADAAGTAAAGPAGAAAAQEAGPAVPPEDRTFRQWYAACDNGHDCAAYTGSDSGGFVLVRQAAGPEGRPEIRVGVSAFAGADSVEGLRLTVDGEAVTLDPGRSDSMSYAVPPGQVAGVLERLAGARTIQVGMGDTQSDLPTAGASAAFLWIDEKQGRLNTTTALVRRGSGAASSVPAPPVLPRVMAAAAVDQGDLAGAGDPGEQGDEAGVALPAALEALAEVRQCREDTAYNAYLQKAVLGGRLSADTELWGVPCDSGAYNARYDFYLTGPGGTDPRKATFPDWQGQTPAAEEGDMVGDGLVNPRFDPQTNTIRHFAKARGLGDCGIDQSWAWTGQGFVLTRQAFMGECWGIAPDLWPTTWRTR